MRFKHSIRCVTLASLALALSGAQAADATRSTSGSASQPTQATKPLTGKQKATAIGATTGAVAGAVVGGPVGAVVGAGIGGYVGHEGTDANGRVASAANGNGTADGSVRSAQTALLDRGYSVGAVDGLWGPNTQSAVRRFQADHGIAQTGTLDDATLSALGVNR